MQEQPVSFKLSWIKEGLWTERKPKVEASDGQHYKIFRKQFGCMKEIVGLRQNGASILRLKPNDRGIQQILEVRTCTKPWKTTATLVYGGLKVDVLELPTFHLEMPMQTQRGIRRLKNDAFYAKMDHEKCVITVHPGFLDIAEELLLLSYWIWTSWGNDSS